MRVSAYDIAQARAHAEVRARVWASGRSRALAQTFRCGGRSLRPHDGVGVVAAVVVGVAHAG
ncbi:hypothetical protein ACFQ07_10365, partial [Actinomadura adrarensis]